MKLAPTIAILGSLLTVGSLHAKWSRIPTVKEKPVNTITGLASNATLDSSSGVGHVDAIFSNDITAPSSFSAGKSFVVINLGKPVLIARSSFVNDGVEGRATISASADKSGWAVLEEKIISAADRVVEFKFAGMQAKYIKLELALSKGGMVRNLQFFGAPTDKGYAIKQSADGKEGKPMDLINGLGGARVIYAAPKPAGGLDNAITFNQFSFPESDEKYRTVIYDFGQLRILKEFASLHSPRPVRFEVFAFDNLPEKEDWRGRMAFDPSDFGSVAPVAVAEDTRGLGELKVKPARPVKTRYLAMRWEPEFNPPDFQCTGSSTGNVVEVFTSTTTTVTDPVTKVTTVTTTTVGSAPGAGSSTSPVTPDTPGQQTAQGNAQSGDSTTVTSSTYAPGINPSSPGAQPTTTTTTSGNTTTTVTNTQGGGSVTVTTSKGSDPSGNPLTTTTTVTTTPNGTPTTSTVTTDGNGNPVNTPPVTSNNPNQQTPSGTTTGVNNPSTLSGGAGSPAPNGGGSTNVSSTNTNTTAPPVTSP